MTYQEFIAQSIALLQQRENDPFNDAKTDVLALLGFVTGKDRSFFIAFGDEILDSNHYEQLQILLQKRLQGEPIAYILGQKDFWNLTLKTSSATLIPRSDTEILVEQVLNSAYQKLEKKDCIKILDLGTGTGAIALALASELGKKAQILGIDFAEQAVEIAIENAKINNISTACFKQSNWFENIANERFDIIVSNPPYIDEQDPFLHLGDVRFEPKTALVADDNGFKDLMHIIKHSRNFLEPQGILFLEHGYKQAIQLQQIFTQHNFQQIQTFKDYNNLDRITCGKIF